MSDPRERKRRAPPPLTRKLLRRASDTHLKRFWPSVFQMRRVLQRRAKKCLDHHGGDPDEAAALIEAMLDELLEQGLLNDKRFTDAWVRDLHRRGIAQRAIRARMLTKGVDKALVSAALAELGESVAEPELARACAYARRRKLGVARPEHRRPTERAEQRKRREKDLAAMCRAGFSLGLALKVIDAPDLEELAAQAEG